MSDTKPDTFTPGCESVCEDCRSRRREADYDGADGTWTTTWACDDPQPECWEGWEEPAPDECPPGCPGPCVIGCGGDSYANRSQFEGTLTDLAALWRVVEAAAVHSDCDIARPGDNCACPDTQQALCHALADLRDAAFIAHHSPAYILALNERLRLAEAENERGRAVVEAVKRRMECCFDVRPSKCDVPLCDWRAVCAALAAYDGGAK